MNNLKRHLVGIPLVAALFALFAAADVASAQFLDRPGVVLVNESNQEVRVYAYAQDPADRVLLGWIGGQELEYFPVPDEARTELGHYTIGVQQITPLPQIGVSATPHPMETTPMLDPGVDGTVRVVLDGNFELTHRIVP
jgi:hypothetical protein